LRFGEEKMAMKSQTESKGWLLNVGRIEKMRRKIIFVIVITFLLYLIFGAVLAHWYKHDIDAFWIAISLYGMSCIFFGLFCIKSVEMQGEDHDDGR
jgi:uncharacterized ion transporter superfamily protein YfcC